MGKSFEDLLNDYECDEELKKQIKRIYKTPFFQNPFINNKDLIEWCIEWDKVRKSILKHFTA